MLSLQDQLAALNAKANNTSIHAKRDRLRRFLEHIYDRYPPKEESHQLHGDLKSDAGLVTAYTKSLRHYHPDKQVSVCVLVILRSHHVQNVRH